jgi:ubiquinone/menaquinone biosynthesis C-methylase UbiE
LILGADANYWEAVAAHWAKQRPHGLWRIHSDSVNTMLFSKWLGTTRVASVLKTDLFDEAFGPGLCGHLSARSKLFVGIDISHDVLRAARSSHEDLTSLCADARCLPFADGTFDIVLSNSSLDHFRTANEILTSLREIHRVLKRSGRLLLTLDNLANPIIALRNVLPFCFLHKAGIVPYYVGATYGPRKLRKVLESVGFRVKRVDALLHSPRAIAVFFSYLVDKKASQSKKRKLLQALMAFEHFSRLPTKFITGYYVAANAQKE